jgi:hypothetical protein
MGNFFLGSLERNRFEDGTTDWLFDSFSVLLSLVFAVELGKHALVISDWIHPGEIPASHALGIESGVGHASISRSG